MAVRVVFVRSKSPAGIEPRLAKEAGSLVRAGFEVHAILWDRGLAYPKEEARDGVRIHRFRLRAAEGQTSLALRLPRWWAHVFLGLLRLRPEVVHAVDFDTVIPAYAAARIAGARLVYDIFDFYAEMITAPLPPRLRRLLANWERTMIPRADAVIVPDLRRRGQIGTARPKVPGETLNLPEDRAVPPAPEDPGQFAELFNELIPREHCLEVLRLAL